MPRLGTTKYASRVAVQMGQEMSCTILQVSVFTRLYIAGVLCGRPGQTIVLPKMMVAGRNSAWIARLKVEPYSVSLRLNVLELYVAASVTSPDAFEQRALPQKTLLTAGGSPAGAGQPARFEIVYPRALTRFLRHSPKISNRGTRILTQTKARPGLGFFLALLGFAGVCQPTCSAS